MDGTRKYVWYPGTERCPDFFLRCDWTDEKKKNWNHERHEKGKPTMVT